MPNFNRGDVTTFTLNVNQNVLVTGTATFKVLPLGGTTQYGNISGINQPLGDFANQTTVTLTFDTAGSYQINNISKNTNNFYVDQKSYAGDLFSDPTALKDVNYGYQVSDNWLNKTSKKLFTCLRNNAGAAVWKLVPLNSPYVVDAAGATAIACYGVNKLVKAYAGAAFQITLPSTATLDIGFVSDGNGGEVADWAAADKFCAGVVGRITTWYDQSGGALHMTQGTYANAPTYSPYALQESPRGIVFDGFAVTKTLALPAGVAVNRQSFSAYVIGNLLGSAANSGMLELGSGVLASSALMYLNSPNLSAYTGSIRSSGIIPHVGPCASVFETIVDPANTKVGQDDRITTVSAAVASVALTGGKLGIATTPNYPLCGTVHALIVYASTITDPQRTALKQQAYRTFGIAPQLRTGMVLVGDSLEFGGQLGVTANPKAFQLNKLTYQNKRIYNLGISGKTAASMVTDIAWTQTVAGQNIQNYGSIEAGTNDATASTPAATIAGYLQSMASTMKGYGYTKISMSTMIARGGGAGTICDALSVLIRGGFGQDYTIDYNADPAIGSGQNLNTTWFNADGVHLLETGQAVKTVLFENQWKDIA